MSHADDAAPIPEGEADACERLFAEFLERYHAGEADPGELFLAHPEHAGTLRRFWACLESAGEVRQPRPAGVPFGKYRLLRQLGAGAQGTVHLAEDTQLGRQVALKILPLHRAVRAEAIGRFRREAAMVARLDHPGICTVYEAGEQDSAAFIAMRFAEGTTLAALLVDARKAGQPLPFARALELVELVATALHAAHEAGLVHRDVKPGNIMVAPDGRPVVLDFGLARDASAGSEASELTRTGDMLGTPAYMSPEQLHGNRIAVDARTDVYSLGVVLFECLTLRRPFEAPTVEQLYQQILTAPVPDLRRSRRDLDRDTALVVATALAKDREHRYASAAAFAEDLRRLRNRAPILARPIGWLRYATAWSRRRPGIAASIAVTAVTLVASTIVSLALFFRADAAREAFEQLADIERLRAANAAAERLYPATPSLAPRLADWLEQQGRPLAQRLPLHRDTLQRVRDRALARTAGDADRDGPDLDLERLARLRERREGLERAAESAPHAQARTYAAARIAKLDREIAAAEQEIRTRIRYTFADPEQAFLHENLELLVAGLERFTAPGGTLELVEARWTFARAIEHATVVEPGDAWRSVAADVAASPRYQHRTLPPQLGLVPLGADPESGLQEFACLAGGTVPVRDPGTRRLQLSAESAPVFVLIPPCRFVPGEGQPDEPVTGPETAADERPAAAIDLDWFLIGKHELTRAQWQRLSAEPVGFSLGDDLLGPEAALHPATELTWDRCVEVLARHELVLPTEVQWECAARGGASTPYWGGNASVAGFANCRGGAERGPGRAPVDDGFELTAPVTALLPNPFGLHHVVGNVAEWCRESFALRAHRKYAPRPGDGEVPVPASSRKPVRGGSFMHLVAAMRPSCRGPRSAADGYGDVGVRPVRAVVP
jgi:serine/threonine protein kinase/formylglycine-generating enzyme required for sulfatase activity